jgi:hypothetical protein
VKRNTTRDAECPPSQTALLKILYQAFGLCPAPTTFLNNRSRISHDSTSTCDHTLEKSGFARMDTIDSTRIAASASKDRVDTEQALRSTRAALRRQVREWQKQADRDDQKPSGLDSEPL